MRWSWAKHREQDIERELLAHLAAESADREADGLSREEADYAARRQFGGSLTSTAEDLLDIWRSGPVERLLKDVRISTRTLLKTPSFTIFAVLALALGLGANAAIFSVVDAVLIRSLPFRNSNQLVEIWEDASQVGFPQAPLAPANFVDWRARNHVFEDMAALKGDLFSLTGAGTPEQLECTQISANLLPLLGVRPMLGRNFLPQEDRPGGPRVVLLSYNLWQRRFSADRGIVNRDIRLNDEKYIVIGVMPRGITFPESSAIWVPLGLGPQALAERGNHYLRVFARLKPGMTLAQARREMADLAIRSAREHPETNTGIGTVVVTLRDQLVGNLKPTLWIVAAGVGCVLLIACTNLAGLLLTRGVGREREFAVRAALGAGRFRLIRQTLVESFLLAAAGGTAAVLIAAGSLPFLRHFVPAALSTWSEPQIDPRVLVFLLLLSGLTALVFGTVPALLSSRTNLSASLQQGGRVSASGSTRIRQGLIVAQVSLTLVLLVAAGLLTKTVSALSHVPLGFNPEPVFTLRTALPASATSRYRDFAARTNFYSRVLENVTSIPGVISAGYTTFLPLTNTGGTSPFTVEGAPPLAPGTSNDANHRVISPDYFKTIGVALRAGRFFRDSDGPDAPPVAIINQAMGRQFWPGQNPLQRRFRLDRVPGVWFTVVGVVDNIRQTALDVSGRAEMYFPYTQPQGTQGYLTPRDLAVRVSGAAMQYSKAIEGAIWSVDRNQPVADVMPMQELISNKLIARKIALKLIAAFAGLALLLAALGLYGLLAFVVLQQRREIGIRMAIGGDARRVARDVLRGGLQLVFLGVAFGTVASWTVMRGLKSVLFEVGSTDVNVFVASAFVLCAVGLAASYLPARRAAGTDPTSALRYE